jgi:hypothetical protein
MIHAALLNTMAYIDSQLADMPVHPCSLRTVRTSSKQSLDVEQCRIEAKLLHLECQNKALREYN